jgi:quinol monooxygenase YgiN
MSEPLTIFARFRAKAGQESRLRQELLGLITPTRAEAGCINYDLHQSQSDPALFVFYEDWTSQAALDAHFQTPYLKGFLKLVPDLVDESPDITKWTKLP